MRECYGHYDQDSWKCEKCEDMINCPEPKMSRDAKIFVAMLIATPIVGAIAWYGMRGICVGIVALAS